MKEQVIEKEIEMEEEEKIGKFKWFLFVIVIPLLFTITLALVIATVAGFNVFGAIQKYGTNIPYVSEWLNGKQQTTDQILQKTMLEQKAMIDEKTQQVKKLETTIKNKQSEIDTLKQEIQRLNAELIAVRQQQEGTTTSVTKPTVQDIVKIYETMSEKNAADIISRMSENDAVNILASLSSEKVAAILEKMNPVNAAKYTTLLAKRAEANTIR
ncbi:MotE family protein [Anoxybacteroides amylolyticum]|uniref:MgtE intracellular N domain protein n=1 Tax=Anoxybacteroides amylolyticum TaxID=294699 RepID=A0A160F4F6_9BACL|nr:MotE family protein [Anoxybacillus amylolyticus]ANB60635.1 mgtE intracellular N domain protein [Anoxybacillus amylolyticus]